MASNRVDWKVAQKTKAVLHLCHLGSKSWQKTYQIESTLYSKQTNITFWLAALKKLFIITCWSFYIACTFEKIHARWPRWSRCSECHRLHALPGPGTQLPRSLVHHLGECALPTDTMCWNQEVYFQCMVAFFCFLFDCLLTCFIVVTKFRWACWKGIIFASGLLNPSLLREDQLWEGRS